MGMYTELVLACELKRDVPQEVLNLLRFLCGGPERPPRPAEEDLPKHPLFHTSRWESVLNAGSFYFPGEPFSWLRVDEGGGARLTVRSNLKNYGSEIEYFAQWLAPYSASEGFVGYYRYEEAPRPTLVFFHQGRARIETARGSNSPDDWLYLDETLLDLDEYLEDMDADDEEEEEH